MADIILAEHQGQAWLVNGEGHIDDLLAGMLRPNLTIEFVSCESKSDVIALWVQHCGEPGSAAAPWVIHPAIVTRLRHKPTGHHVYFTAWSALLDDAARAAIGAAAAQAAAFGAADVVLTRHLESGAPQALADLANLRTSLISALLVTLGTPPDHVVIETNTPGQADSADSDRFDIVVNQA